MFLVPGPAEQDNLKGHAEQISKINQGLPAAGKHQHKPARVYPPWERDRLEPR